MVGLVQNITQMVGGGKMLCCRCKKNLAVVYVTRMDPDGTSKNEGYCLTCAQELNLGPVNDMMKNMD